MEKSLHRISLNLWISAWRTIQESRRTRNGNLYLFFNIWEKKKLCYIPEIQEVICDCSITLHSLVRFYYWEKVIESGKYEARNYCENRFHEVAEFRLKSTKLYMLCESELRKHNWLTVKILFKKSACKRKRDNLETWYGAGKIKRNGSSMGILDVM